MTPLNRLYGILTDGDNEVRKTTATRDNLSQPAQKIAEALFPGTISDAGIRALAEIYIRIGQTDQEFVALLSEKDPINSYNLHSFDESFEDTIDINDIVLAIRHIGLPAEENSFLPIDYIINALKQLLKALDVAH